MHWNIFQCVLLYCSVFCHWGHNREPSRTECGEYVLCSVIEVIIESPHALSVVNMFMHVFKATSVQCYRYLSRWRWKFKQYVSLYLILIYTSIHYLLTWHKMIFCSMHEIKFISYRALYTVKESFEEFGPGPPIPRSFRVFSCYRRSNEIRGKFKVH